MFVSVLKMSLSWCCDVCLVCREQEFSYKDGAFAHTARPSRMRESHRPKFDVLLTSYEFVSQDSVTLSSIDWDVLIIDEAHRLKNNQSLVSQDTSQCGTVVLRHGSADTVVRAMNDSNGKCRFSGSDSSETL